MLKLIVVALLLAQLCSLSGSQFLTDLLQLPWDDVNDLSQTINGRSVAFPNARTREAFHESDKCVEGNFAATRMQMYRDRAIVVAPRYKLGVPITLGILCLSGEASHPKLYPFPNWRMQNEGDCDTAIQSAIDVYLDRSDVLWVLDAGEVQTMGNSISKCGPKIVGIKMSTRKVLATVNLSKYVLEDSRLEYIVAEMAGDGDTYVYVSDARGAIIMINPHCLEVQRLELPHCAELTPPGESSLYLTILMKADYKNYLYFSYGNCDKLFYLETSDLRRGGPKGGGIMLAGSKPEGGEIVFCGTDNFSTLYFRHKDNNDVFSWDANTRWEAGNWLRVKNDCDFERQVTQVAPGPNKMMWMMETNFHDFENNSCGSGGASTRLRPLAKGHKSFLSTLSNRLIWRLR